MECANVEPRLSAYADGELEDLRELEHHLASCGRCRRKLALMRALREAIAAVPAESVSGRFTAAFGRRLAEEHRARPHSARRPLILLTGTVAAALLLGLWAATQRRPVASPVPAAPASATAPGSAPGLDCGLDPQPQRAEDERPCASVASCGSLQAVAGVFTAPARPQPACIKG